MDLEQLIGSPPCAADLRREIMSLREQYRGQGLHVFSAGKSTGGRNILAMGLGDVRGAPMYVSGVHGGDWLATLVLLRFVRALLESRQTGVPFAGMDLSALQSDVRLLVVPCLNPDGLELFLHGAGAAGHLSGFVRGLWRKDTPWQANLRGVDLAKNFDCGWRQTGSPSPKGSSGCKPFSEPESRCIANLCAGVGPRSLYLLGRGKEEFSCRCGAIAPPKAALMGQLLASACGSRPAPSREPQGCLTEWFIRNANRPAFGIYTGSTTPDTLAELEPVFARLAEALVLGLVM